MPIWFFEEYHTLVGDLANQNKVNNSLKKIDRHQIDT